MRVGGDLAVPSSHLFASQSVTDAVATFGRERAAR